jgi:glucosyl-dolichyl phosphate glucuronosyltransferase
MSDVDCAARDHLQSDVPQSLKASVVVCVYTEKRLPQIRMALDSVRGQTTPPWEVIVVADHNSALGDLLALEYPGIEVISNKFEKGLSGARNTGVEQSDGDVVVFLDDDARAHPQWLETLLAPYGDASVLGVGGLVLADWGSSRRPAWLPEEFLWVVGCSYRGLPEGKAEVRNPVGANMSFRRTAFAQAGLFDSSIGRTFASSRPLGCEETEFSIRLRSLSPDARIIYAEGCSKAQVTRLSGAGAALSSERTYVTSTIPRAAHRELKGILRSGRKDAAKRLTALFLGMSWTGAGYAAKTILQKSLEFRKTGGQE